MNSTGLWIYALLVASAAIVISCNGLPQNAKLQKKPPTNESGVCAANSNELAERVEVCAQPLMDILQGTITKWPTNNEEAKELCDTFVGSERCTRETARKCAKGLQKTIVSTLANSIARARKRECQPAKYSSIVKTTQCIRKDQASVHQLMANITSRLVVIEAQIKDLDEKTTATCCLIDEIEREIRALFDKNCPGEGDLVIRLYRAILEDVVGLICHKPKCNNPLAKYKITYNQDHLGIASVLLRIVFSLG